MENELFNLVKKLFTCDNIVKNSIKINGEEYEAQQFNENFLDNEQSDSNYISFNILDKRENIMVDPYLMDRGYLSISSESEQRKDIYKDIVNSLNEKFNLGEEINNKKISISKNYISEDEAGKDEEGIWGGWHSLFDNKINAANNFKYYIFCVKEETTYYTIVFEEKKFKDYLKLKQVDKSGKYNFYFTGFDSSGGNNDNK